MYAEYKEVDDQRILYCLFVFAIPTSILLANNERLPWLDDYFKHVFLLYFLY